MQYRLREQGAHAKPLLAKLEDQTERFRRAVEAIDLALAGQPHGDDNDDHDDKPASKTGDNARVAEEARLPSPAPRTIGFAFPTNVPPPPWATTAPMTPPTQTRTPTATRGNGDDAHDRDADADEEPSRRASGGGRSYWDDFATTASGSSPPRGSGAGGGGRSSWDDFATTARSSSPPRDSGADGGGRSYWSDFGTTARSSSPPPPFSLPPVVRRQSNLPSASVPSAYPAPTVRRVGGCTAGGGAYAVVDLERRAPKRPPSLKEVRTSSLRRGGGSQTDDSMCVGGRVRFFFPAVRGAGGECGGVGQRDGRAECRRATFRRGQGALPQVHRYCACVSSE